MKFLLPLIAVSAALLLVVSCEEAVSEVSTQNVEAKAEAPATETPATEAPATEAPATEAPATEAPATEAPATEAPATEAPATEAPATEAPATEAPATEASEEVAAGSDAEGKAPEQARTPGQVLQKKLLDIIEAADKAKASARKILTNDKVKSVQGDLQAIIDEAKKAVKHVKNVAEGTATVQKLQSESSAILTRAQDAIKSVTGSIQESKLGEKFQSELQVLNNRANDVVEQIKESDGGKKLKEVHDQVQQAPQKFKDSLENGNFANKIDEHVEKIGGHAQQAASFLKGKVTDLASGLGGFFGFGPTTEASIQETATTEAS